MIFSDQLFLSFLQLFDDFFWPLRNFFWMNSNTAPKTRSHSATLVAIGYVSDFLHDVTNSHYLRRSQREPIKMTKACTQFEANCIEEPGRLCLGFHLVDATARVPLHLFVNKTWDHILQSSDGGEADETALGGVQEDHLWNEWTRVNAF